MSKNIKPLTNDELRKAKHQLCLQVNHYFEVSENITLYLLLM